MKRILVVLAVVGCQSTRPTPVQQWATAAAAAVFDSTPPAPSFAAGTYELVLLRGSPMLDDSAHAQRMIDSLPYWRGLDRARSHRDSVRALQKLIQSTGYGRDEYLGSLKEAANTKDSSKVVWEYFRDISCVSWIVSGSLELDVNGHYVDTKMSKRYCRGDRPRFTRHADVERDSLRACEEPAPPIPSTVTHMTCNLGRYGKDQLSYHFFGDTLQLGQFCDARNTYVLRLPATPPVASAADAYFSDGTCLGNGLPPKTHRSLANYVSVRRVELLESDEQLPRPRREAEQRERLQDPR
jgi:hypothetical protein